MASRTSAHEDVGFAYCRHLIERKQSRAAREVYVREAALASRDLKVHVKEEEFPRRRAHGAQRRGNSSFSSQWDRGNYLVKGDPRDVFSDPLVETMQVRIKTP